MTKRKKRVKISNVLAIRPLSAVSDFTLVSDEMLTIAGACAFAKCGRSKIYAFFDEGLPYVSIGRGRRIPRRALVEFLSARLVRPGQGDRDRAAS